MKRRQRSLEELVKNCFLHKIIKRGFATIAETRAYRRKLMILIFVKVKMAYGFTKVLKRHRGY